MNCSPRTRIFRGRTNDTVLNDLYSRPTEACYLLTLLLTVPLLFRYDSSQSIHTPTQHVYAVQYSKPRQGPALQSFRGPYTAHDFPCQSKCATFIQTKSKATRGPAHRHHFKRIRLYSFYDFDLLLRCLRVSVAQYFEFHGLVIIIHSLIVLACQDRSSCSMGRWTGACSSIYLCCRISYGCQRE